MEIFNRFFVIGLSHRECSVEQRGSLSIFKDQQKDYLDDFSTRLGLRGIVILSTCNRLEVYGQKDTDKQDVLDFFSDFFQTCMGNQYICPYQKVGVDSVCHLFRVASGLSSMLLGENEILGQVRNAYFQSAEYGRAGVFHKIFQQAIRVGKLIRTSTDISKGSISITSVCVELVKKNSQFHAQSLVVVVGAGKIASSFVRDLFLKGYKNIVICNRTISKAQEIATAYQLRAIYLEQLEDFLSQADIVVAAASAKEYLISKISVSKIQSSGKKIPIFIDISVPGCIDPRIASMDGVTLYTLDHVDQMVQKKNQFRQKELVKAEMIVDDQLKKFSSQYQKHFIFSSLQKLYRNEGLSTLREFLLDLGEKNLSSFVQKNRFINAVNKIQSPKDFSTVTNFFIENESMWKKIFSLCFV